ncbi:MAG: DUF1670 domain-containing protein [Bacillota bacterium]
MKLYEKKMAPPDIARQVNHSQEAVDRYIKDYERIKFLVRRGLDITEISHLTGRGKQVVKQHLEVIKRYHPELFESKIIPDKCPHMCIPQKRILMQVNHGCSRRFRRDSSRPAGFFHPAC